MTSETFLSSVTVVVPARNAAESLLPCIESIRSQGAPVIVVDDGSVDDTADVAEKAGAVVLRQTPKGPAAARNLGARHAAGEILLFTDADCLPAAQWVSEMVKPFEDETVVGVKGVYSTEQTGWIPQLAQVEFEDRYKLLAKKRSIDMVDTHAAAYRREVFLRYGGFDETFGAASNEDTEFSYRLAEEGNRMVFAPEAVVVHKHPERLWEYARKKFGRGYWRMKAYAKHPGKAARDSYTPQGLKLQILLLPVMAFFAVLVLLGARWIGVIGLSLGAAAFGCFSWTFCLLAWERSPLIAAAAPLFLLVRAVALGLGAGVGWWKFRRKERPCKSSAIHS